MIHIVQIESNKTESKHSTNYNAQKCSSTKHQGRNTLCTYIYYLKFLALGVTINIHVIYIWSSNKHTKPPLSACKLKASDFLQCFGNFGKTLLLLTVTGHKMTSKKVERFYICWYKTILEWEGKQMQETFIEVARCAKP